MLSVVAPANLPPTQKKFSGIKTWFGIKLGLRGGQFRERPNQGKLKGKVSLYHWPPVWLVWNQLYDNWQFLFLFAKQTNPKKVKQEVNSAVILPPLVFPGQTLLATLPKCPSTKNFLKNFVRQLVIFGSIMSLAAIPIFGILVSML